MSKAQTKVQVLKRISRLVEQLKHINCANCPIKFSNEVTECELEIKSLENDLGLIIDNFMSNRFEKFNTDKSRAIITENRQRLLENWKKGRVTLS